MKNSCLFVCLFLLSITGQIQSQATVTQVNYKVKSLQNLDKVNNPEAKIFLEEIYEGFNTLNYVLVFNKTESIFQKLTSMTSDKEEKSLMPSMSETMAFTGKVYTNMSSGLITHLKHLSSDIFLIQYPISDYKWNLTNESKKIDNFTSFKATLTDSVETVRGKRVREIIAWYVPKVSYPFGPANYSGLPGLIIELEINGNIVFYADKILSLPADKAISIQLPSKGKKVTKQEYNYIERNGFSHYQRN